MADITFGKFVTQHRQKKEMTLRGFAAALNLSPEYICNMEKGRKAAPPQETLEKIITVLSISKSEAEQLFDLAADSQNTLSKVPADLTGFIHSNKVIVAALRMAKDVDATDEEWLEFMKKLQSRNNTCGGMEDGGY